MLGIFGAGVGFYFLVMRVPPERVAALNHLRSAKIPHSDNLSLDERQGY